MSYGITKEEFEEAYKRYLYACYYNVLLKDFDYENNGKILEYDRLYYHRYFNIFYAGGRIDTVSCCIGIYDCFEFTYNISYEIFCKALEDILRTYSLSDDEIKEYMLSFKVFHKATIITLNKRD